MTVNLSFVTDPHNRFYAGMTLQEAKEDGTDKSFWRRDFHNLDKDKDGVLSVNEIMNERKRYSRNNKWLAAGFGLWGLLDLSTMNKTSKAWLAVDLLFDAFLMFSSAASAYSCDRGTKRIEKELAKLDEHKQLELNA